MAKLEVNGVPIQDDYSETFSGRLARVLVTSVTRRWALEAAMETKGLGRSATAPPCEATLEREVGPDETPDGRPGFIIQMMDRKLEQLARCLVLRIRKGALPNPKTSVFDALPAELAEESIDLEGTIIPRFGDGWEEAARAFGREVFRVPKMDGVFHVERRFGVVREAVTGGMFLILADSDERALRAAEAALDEVSRIPLVVVKNAASGSKVGARHYHDMVATTNHRYCPTLTGASPTLTGSRPTLAGSRPTLAGSRPTLAGSRPTLAGSRPTLAGSRPTLAGDVESALPDSVRCVYEIIVSAPRLEEVRRGMRAGIEAATAAGGVVEIHTANYGGKLGKGRISLHALFE